MFRFEVLVLAAILSTPVLALGMRGDLTLEETAIRAALCLGAAWFAVSVIMAAARPLSRRDDGDGERE